MERDTKDRDSDWIPRFRLDPAAWQVEDDTCAEEKKDDMQLVLNSLVPSIDSLTIDGENGDYFPILAQRFRLDPAAWQVEDDTCAEEKKDDMLMSLNSLIPSIDNLTIDGENGDYFPILALPPHNLDLVFASLSPKDRLALAAVNNYLNKIESESKYYVKTLAITEIPAIPAPLSMQTKVVFEKYEHSIVLFENKSYSSDFLRRFAHNASIGHIYIKLTGSSEFHREIYNLLKQIDIGRLSLYFYNGDLQKEIMMESFLIDLTRSCKVIHISLNYVTPSTFHEVYKIMFDGSAKIRLLHSFVVLEKCVAFLHVIGITFRNGRFFSNRRDIEVYKEHSGDDDDEEEEDVMKGRWHIFAGHLEMILDRGNFRITVRFNLIYHETKESLEEAKNEEGIRRIEIGAE